MRCEICGEIDELENGLCWYCEEDVKESEPYAGGMEPRSVFPLMDELELEWGITDEC